MHNENKKENTNALMGVGRHCIADGKILFSMIFEVLKLNAGL